LQKKALKMIFNILINSNAGDLVRLWVVIWGIIPYQIYTLTPQIGYDI